MEQLVSRVWEYSLNNPEGFTLNVETMKPVTSGICVAYAETQGSHSFECLELVINHALQHDKVVGGWLNTADSKYYLDSVRVFNQNEREEALAFAIANEQIAIFDLDNLEAITINK